MRKKQDNYRKKLAINDLIDCTIVNIKINYFLPKISYLSSAFRHVKRGGRVHYGNVVV